MVKIIKFYSNGIKNLYSNILEVNSFSKYNIPFLLILSLSLIINSILQDVHFLMIIDFAMS